MHPALQITEILDIIFNDSVLLFNTKPPQWPQHLSLGLTCKAFTKPAMRILWRQIDGIDRLLRTMGEGVIKVVGPVSEAKRVVPRWQPGRYEEDGDGEEPWDDEWDQLSEDEHEPSKKRKPGRGYIIFKREPVDQDWEPFDRYAIHVRGFGLNGSPDYLKFSRNVYDALRARRIEKGTSLLPNLWSLACSNRQLRYASLLLAPGIHTLQILRGNLYHPPPYNGAAFVNDLALFFEEVKSNPPPALGTIYMHSLVSPHPIHTHLFSEMVVHCHRQGVGLERIRTSYPLVLTPEALRVVLTEKNVKSVDVEVTMENPDSDRFFGEDTFTRDIRNLVITFTKTTGDNQAMPESSFYQELAQRLHTTKLANLSIYKPPHTPRPRDLNALFSVLRQGGGFSREVLLIPSPKIHIAGANDLHHISSSSDYPVCTFSNAFHILCQPTTSTVHPSQFAYLHQLDLVDVPVDLSDDELGTLSAALPRLGIFSVGQKRGAREGRSKTTLVGLWLMAKNCRHLVNMQIWINAVFDRDNFAAAAGVDIPRNTNRQRKLVARGRNKNLQVLRVGNSDIQSPRMVADFLEAAFPNITLLEFDKEMGPDGELWERVLFSLYNRVASMVLRPFGTAS